MNTDTETSYYDPAGFGSRLVANIIDGILLSLISLVLALIVTNGFQTTAQEKDGFAEVLGFLYQLLLPVFWSGYTIGKRAMRIRIVKMNGSNVTIWTMLMRVVVAGIVYGITFGICIIISIFMVALRKDKRAIHDFIAGTYVMKA